MISHWIVLENILPVDKMATYTEHIHILHPLDHRVLSELTN
jgi:hypothetical protein